MLSVCCNARPWFECELEDGICGECGNKTEFYREDHELEELSDLMWVESVIKRTNDLNKAIVESCIEQGIAFNGGVHG